MKIKKTLQETTDRKTYRSAANTGHGNCSLCSPNRGCNRNRKYDRSWKKYRKTQWREK